MSKGLLVFVLIFCAGFVCAGNFGIQSEVLSPWIEVEGVSGELCAPKAVANVDGAFYLNYDALVGCSGDVYEIEVEMIRQIDFWFDEVLDTKTVYRSCNYWDLENDALAPMKVAFETNFKLGDYFENLASEENVYFHAEVVDGPGNFEFNFNSGDEIISDVFYFEFVDCKTCSSGACCEDGFVKGGNSQPIGIEDEYFCSGEPFSWDHNPLYKRDYFCDGSSSEEKSSVDFHYRDCGYCRYCEEGSSECKNFEFGKFFRGISCDHLDTECRDYRDSYNYCDGAGGVLNGSCGLYNNAVAGTECSGGVCDGDGNCVAKECISHTQKRCYSGDIWWGNSCDEREDKYLDCQWGCWENLTCMPRPVVACYNDDDCGRTTWIECDLSKKYLSKWDNNIECINDGKTNSYCEDKEDLFVEDVEECVLWCENDTCLNEIGNCQTDDDCGEDFNETFCSGDSIIFRPVHNYCAHPQTYGAECRQNRTWNVIENCSNGCVNGVCLPGEDFVVSLVEGWNLISIPYDVSDRSLSEIFGSCWSQVSQIKDDKKFFKKSLPDYLNSLSSMSSTKGYWVDMTGSCVLNLEDVSMPTDFYQNFSEGWNLISVDEDSTMEEYFGDNFIFVEQIKDDKKFFKKSLPDYLNSLSSLEKGKGYWVFVNKSFAIEKV